MPREPKAPRDRGEAAPDRNRNPGCCGGQPEAECRLRPPDPAGFQAAAYFGMDDCGCKKAKSGLEMASVITLLLLPHSSGDPFEADQ